MPALGIKACQQTSVLAMQSSFLLSRPTKCMRECHFCQSSSSVLAHLSVSINCAASEGECHAAGKRNPGDARWLQQVHKSGTTNDRVAALTLTLQVWAVVDKSSSSRGIVSDDDFEVRVLSFEPDKCLQIWCVYVRDNCSKRSEIRSRLPPPS